MNELILRMTEPIVKSYSPTSNPVAIIQSYDGTHPWLLNHFVQLICWHNYFVDYGDFDYKKCPLIDAQRMNKKYVEDFGGIINFLIDAIQNGYYAYFVINKRCIPLYNSINDKPHDIFVYGYNQDKRIFYVADNFKNGKYSFEVCSFNELAEAYYNISEEDESYLTFDRCIDLLSYKSDPSNPVYFDPIIFKQSLEDYLNSRNVHQKYPLNSFIHDRGKHTFGISTYSVLSDHIEQFHLNQDIRPFHVFMEHKNIMLQRMIYLNDNDLITRKYEEIFTKINSVLHNTRIIRKNLIKYSIKPDENILVDIKPSLDNTRDIESKFMELLLHNLRI